MELRQHLEPISLGTTITVVFKQDTGPAAVFCTVLSLAPLCLAARSSSLPNLTLPGKVSLMWQPGEGMMRGDAIIDDIVEIEGQACLAIGDVHWEALERRSTNRVPFSRPVSLRAVHEVSGAPVISLFEGVAVDLSTGGIRVRTANPIEEGSLVECHLDAGNAGIIRAFGIVAHHRTSEYDLGVYFIDYIGSARAEIEEIVAAA